VTARRPLVAGRAAVVTIGALVVTLACAIPLPTVEPLTVVDPQEESHQVLLGDEQRASVRLRLLSDTLDVRAGSDESLLSGQFRFNVAEWAPKIEQSSEAGTLRVTVDQGLGSQIPLGKNDDYANAWDVQLARSTPLDLDVDMGAGTANLDLTGLALEKLSVTSGSTDLRLAFSAPNPRPLGTLKLTAGTGTVTATGLGNANFDTLSLLGGTGKIDLDFSGAFQRSAVADVKAGAGTITVRVPADLGVRVTLSGVLSVAGVEGIGFAEESDGVYVNAAYGISPLTLTVRIGTGVGAVSLISE